MSGNCDGWAVILGKKRHRFADFFWRQAASAPGIHLSYTYYQQHIHIL
jgi:hypothetical protein